MSTCQRMALLRQTCSDQLTTDCTRIFETFMLRASLPSLSLSSLTCNGVREQVYSCQEHLYCYIVCGHHRQETVCWLIDKGDAMPKAKAKLSWSAALEIYILSEPHSGEDRSITPESPAWFAWLAERSSFAFQGQQGSFSALLEAVQRGERYWYAYLRTGQQVRKKYLGKTADLTLARLEQVARLLQAELASGGPPGPALPAQEEQQEASATPEVITSGQRTAPVPVTVVE